MRSAVRRRAASWGLLLWIAAARAEDAGFFPADAGAPDAGSPEQVGEPCAAERNRVERRKAWLGERYREQAAKGFPDPKAGIPNMMAVFCDANPSHEECTLGNPPIEFTPDELTWAAQQTFEDRDPHVIALKRALAACRRKR